MEFLNDAVPIVLHHHEKYDGTGYPEDQQRTNSAGREIIAVADAIDAMLSDRPMPGQSPFPR